MAGDRRVTLHRRLLLCLLAWSSRVDVAAGGRSLADASSHGGGSGSLADASSDGGGAESAPCASMKQMVTKGEMPPDVYSLLTDKDALEEYSNLVRALSLAKRGTLNAFKCSALYRAMYIGRHERAFQKKGVSIFLTKQDKEGPLASFRKSLIQVCFAEGADTPPPEHVYHDAKTIEVRVDTFRQTKWTSPNGVVGQPYSQEMGRPPLLADKSTMPVDILKLLEKKDALLLHADMAALINIRQWSPDFAYRVVKRFAERFREKGLEVRLIKRRVKRKEVAHGDPTGFAYDVWEEFCWLEYIDLGKEGSATKLEPEAKPSSSADAGEQLA